MKYFKKVTIVMVCCTFTFLSCDIKSLDDIEPKYKLVENNAYNDVGKVEAQLNGVYLTWRDLGYSPGYVQSYGGLYDYRSGSDYYLNTIDASDNYDNPFKLYRDYYEMMQKANYLINAMQNFEDIMGISNTRRVEIEAEARLQRAWSHWELLRVYGQSWDLSSPLGIVVNMDVVRENVAKPRNSVQETYDAILKDLDFAIANAPDAYSDGSRMSRVTAKGVKAQVLLTMNDYVGAAQLAQEVMNSGSYSLEADFGDIFYEGFLSNEFLFSPYSWSPNDYVDDILSSYFRYTTTLSDIADAEVGDPDDGDIATGNGFDPRFAFAHSDATRVNNKYNTKYPLKRGTNLQANSFHILRVAEMYLIFAEAKARLNSGIDSEAVDALNTIRSRAGVPDKNPATKAVLLEEIRKEKILELFGEWAQPWFDLIRYHKLGDINITDYRTNITNDDKLIWPIPERVLVANNQLIQNPGY